MVQREPKNSVDGFFECSSKVVVNVNLTDNNQKHYKLPVEQTGIFHRPRCSALLLRLKTIVEICRFFTNSIEHAGTNKAVGRRRP